MAMSQPIGWLIIQYLTSSSLTQNSGRLRADIRGIKAFPLNHHRENRLVVRRRTHNRGWDRCAAFQVCLLGFLFGNCFDTDSRNEKACQQSHYTYRQGDKEATV